MIGTVLRAALRKAAAHFESRRNARLDALLQQGQRWHGAGEFDRGDEYYRRVLARDPANARAHHLLGASLGQRGRYAAALPHLRHALERSPDLADAHIDLGNVLRLSGDPAAAESSYRHALALDAGLARAQYGLACCLRATGRLDQAAVHFERAHALAADAPEALRDLVESLLDLGAFERAQRLLESEIERSPDNALAWRGLGLLCLKRLQPETALSHLRKALELGAAAAETLKDIGLALQELGRLDEAIASYEQALALDAGYVVARWHKALVELLRGDFARGWDDYEIRLLSEDRPRRNFPYPRWAGEPVAGRTLLVYAEQGLGDEIMFASCIPDLVARGARPIVDCHPHLERLFARSFPEAIIHGGFQTEDNAWLERCPRPDWQIAAGSLPSLLRRDPAQFPQHRGYLRADAARVAHWRAELDALGPELKVGISWRGGTAASRSALRSLELEQLLPLLRVEGVQFVDLQYTDSSVERAALQARHGIGIRHWPQAIASYDETAALLCALDLVVSVCTAVIHLGGALGRPVWVMAPFVPEWRYGIAGERMPWYPTVTVVRQPRRLDWAPVLERVRQELVRRTGRGTDTA